MILAEKPTSAQPETYAPRTFSISRGAEFCSEKELTAQTGHASKDWPLVMTKELMDNALDACEEEGTPPSIQVHVDETGITVRDNGPGIQPETVEKLVDFTRTVSSRQLYASPTRGAQGNALKTLPAMAHVLSGNATPGVMEIRARQTQHRIQFDVHSLSQEPVVDHKKTTCDLVKKGTYVKIFWPDSARSKLLDAGKRLLRLLRDYTLLNPHLTLKLDLFNEQYEFQATSTTWSKWTPNKPTSPHWYTVDSFDRLLKALTSHDQECAKSRLLRDLLGDFDGLSGSQKRKAVLDATGLTRTRLADLVVEGDLREGVSAALLEAMQANTKSVPPQKLGLIGSSHIRQRFQELGCDMETFKYQKTLEHDYDGFPYVMECAFVWRGDKSPNQRRLITGVNWSPGIINPFRSLGAGSDDGLAALLQKQRAGMAEPVIFLLHVASPCVRHLDRGKSSITLQ